MESQNSTKRRRSIRLKEYDYSQSGAYFVTICTKERECLFGNVADNKICLTEGGKITEVCWKNILQHYPHVLLDEYIVMPNHVHGIIIIDRDPVGVQNLEPLLEPLRFSEQPQNKFQHIIPSSLGSVIRGFKIGVTKWFRQNTDIYNVWQRNYFERIIRNENELNRIRKYIIYNPVKWHEDEENPDSLRAKNAKRTKP